SMGFMAGSLVGPLVGGALPPLIGIRATFMVSGGIIFLAFLATTFLIKEKHPAPARRASPANGGRGGSWAQIPDIRPVIAMLTTGMLLMFATMSIEPIITVYVAQLVENQAHVTMVSGIVMSTTALGT